MNLYLLFKSLHLIAVISWMAGLLYLPRIFVYHSEAAHESQKEVFKTMEKKLYNYIMMPAMFLSWLFGILEKCNVFKHLFILCYCRPRLSRKTKRLFFFFSFSLPLKFTTIIHVVLQCYIFIMHTFSSHIYALLHVNTLLCIYVHVHTFHNFYTSIHFGRISTCGICRHLFISPPRESPLQRGSGFQLAGKCGPIHFYTFSTHLHTFLIHLLALLYFSFTFLYIIMHLFECSCIFIHKYVHASH